jgi:hypothetical protein
MTEGMKRFWILVFGGVMPAVGLYGDVFNITLLDKDSGRFVFTVERYEGGFTFVRGGFSGNEQKKMLCEKYGSITHFSVTDEEVTFAIEGRFFTIGGDRRVVLCSQKDDDTFSVNILAGTSLREGSPFWICFEHVKSGKVHINTRNARGEPGKLGFEYRNPYTEVDDVGAGDSKSVAGVSLKKDPGIRGKRKKTAKNNDFRNDDFGFFARKK